MPIAAIAVIKAKREKLITGSVMLGGMSKQELIIISTTKAIRNVGTLAALALLLSASLKRLITISIINTTGINILTRTNLTNVEISPVVSETE